MTRLDKVVNEAYNTDTETKEHEQTRRTTKKHWSPSLELTNQKYI